MVPLGSLEPVASNSTQPRFSNLTSQSLSPRTKVLIEDSSAILNAEQLNLLLKTARTSIRFLSRGEFKIALRLEPLPETKTANFIKNVLY